MRTLQVVQSAHRCTLEEQDDPVLWIVRALRGAGAELAVLLRENAVTYAVEGLDASGLSLGGRGLTLPPRLDRDLGALAEAGVEVFAVAEDAAERGLDPGRLAAGVRSIPRAELPALFERFDRVWHW